MVRRNNLRGDDRKAEIREGVTDRGEIGRIGRDDLDVEVALGSEHLAHVDHPLGVEGLLGQLSAIVDRVEVLDELDEAFSAARRRVTTGMMSAK